jgi:hypothetical protein
LNCKREERREEERMNKILMKREELKPMTKK